MVLTSHKGYIMILIVLRIDRLRYYWSIFEVELKLTNLYNY